MPDEPEGEEPVDPGLLPFEGVSFFGASLPEAEEESFFDGVLSVDDFSAVGAELSALSLPDFEDERLSVL